MKKLLIATAALAMVAGTVQAQSSVQVYGVLDVGYSDQKISGDIDSVSGSYTEKQVSGKSGLASNRLGFRGTEDLGGGLKAGFVYELGISTETQTQSLRAGNVSLSGSFGGVTIGRQNSIGKNMNDNYTAFGGGGSFLQGSIVHGVTGNAGSGSMLSDADFLNGEFKPLVDRVSNAVTYVSPKFNGLTLTVQANQKSDDTSDLTGKNKVNSSQAVRLDYAAGKLKASVAYTDSTTEEEDGGDKYDVKLTQLGATYDFGVAKAFVAYADGKSTFDGDNYSTKTKGTDIGVIVPVSPKVNLLASIGQGDIKVDNYKSDVDGYMFQAHYALSKRTTAYAMYGVTNLEAPASVAFEIDAVNLEDKVTMIGVRHTF
jgi:predicted porin